MLEVKKIRGKTRRDKEMIGTGAKEEQEEERSKRMKNEKKEGDGG